MWGNKFTSDVAVAVTIIGHPKILTTKVYRIYSVYSICSRWFSREHMGVGQKKIQYIHERIIKCSICLLHNIKNVKSKKGYKKKKDENHILRPEEKDWEPQNHDVTTTSAKTKMKKFQKSIPTEDARPGRNDRLGQDLNPGTYG